MRKILVILYITFFVFSSNSFGCEHSASINHCDKQEYSTNSEVEYCHENKKENQEEHASYNCSCKCHGHYCKSVNLKSWNAVSNINLTTIKTFFPKITIQKISEYYSRLNRPPIS